MPDSDRPVDDPDGDPLAQLRQLADRLDLDRTDLDSAWDEPPPELWDRIAAETGTTDTVDLPTSAGETVTPIDAARPRRRTTRWLAVAAAAIVVAALGIGVAIERAANRPDVVATATLEPIDSTGTGSAELVDSGGNLQLRVNASGVTAGAGDFLEVWVIDPDISKLVSLGPWRPDGVYDLPAGMNPAAFPIVDISVEPMDGNPTHSGDSVLRGQLTF